MINLVWILCIIFILTSTYQSFINNGIPKGSEVRENYLVKYLIKKDSKLNKLYRKDNDLKECLHIKYLAVAYIVNITLCCIFLITIILSVVFFFISDDLYNLFTIVNVIFICIFVIYNACILIRHVRLAQTYDKEYQKLSEIEIEKLRKILSENYNLKF